MGVLEVGAERGWAGNMLSHPMRPTGIHVHLYAQVYCTVHTIILASQSRQSLETGLTVQKSGDSLTFM